MALTRRDFIVGSAATCAMVRTMELNARGKSDFTQVDTSKSLGEHAAAKGILYGAALNVPFLKNDSAYSDIVAKQCRIAVPENGLKWKALRPSQDRYDFSQGDYLCQFVKSHGMKYRGHTLVWGEALPGWFKRTVNAQNAKTMMLDHIRTVIGHYAGQMQSWDVVNEAIDLDDGRPDGLKNTPWLQMIGPEYIEMAFHAAHEADPNAMLVYNEDWLEPEDGTTEKKRRATLALLANLKKKAVPVRGLGIQSHLFTETVVGGPMFARFLDQVTDLGLELFITEMDIRDQHLVGSVQARDQVVAQKYYDYLSFMLQRKSLKAVLTWGLSDRYTWITQHNPRRDGAPPRPLPYDADLKPTLAWNAIAAAFDHAVAR